MKRAFLVSKPLQLMIAGNIKDQYSFGENNILVIWDGFLGSENVANSVDELEQLGWSSVYYFASKNSALAWLKQQSLDELLIDSDVGVSNALTLLTFKLQNWKLKISVFEEGVGTYRNDLYQGFKKKLFSLFGIGSVFGGFCLTSKIFVYKPDVYVTETGNRTIKVSPISGRLGDYIESNLLALHRLFLFEPYNLQKNSSVTLLLSDHKLNERKVDEVVCSLLENSGVAILKPHPHIRTVNSGIRSMFQYQCLATVPSELLIKNLSEVCSQVSVLHYGSSTEAYAHFDNVQYLNVFKPSVGT